MSSSSPSVASPPSNPPPILTGAGPLLENYDVLFCDVWGVLHDGVHAYSGATDALIRFRDRGGTVILVTNAPVPKPRVVAMLEGRRVPASTHDDIVSSGEIALKHIADQAYAAAYYIGPRGRDATFFERAAARGAPLDMAEAIVCTGLVDDVNETAEDYRALLEAGHARGLPFVCANPDLVVEVGGRLFPCAGALADLYARLGGDVFWAGKPHSSAYETARAVAERIRGRATAPDKILVIGDAMRTDIEGAKRAGLDALFIAGGIHRKDTMRDDGSIDGDKLTALFTHDAPRAVAAMAHLAW